MTNEEIDQRILELADIREGIYELTRAVRSLVLEMAALDEELERHRIHRADGCR